MNRIETTECIAVFKTDPTSYGYQWSLDLETDDYGDKIVFKQLENKKVLVRISIIDRDPQPKDTP